MFSLMEKPLLNGIFDGKSEYQIKTIIKQMLIYSSAAKIKGNNDRQIAQAIITGFTGQLQGWWDFYLSKEAKNKILNSSIVDLNGREATLFITDITKSNIMIPKTINWSQVTLPEIWKMESIAPSIKEESRKLESIVQYVDGDVEIKFSSQRHLNIKLSF